MKIVLEELRLFYQFLQKPTFLRVPSNKIDLVKIGQLSFLLIAISLLLDLVTKLPFIIKYFCLGKDLVEKDILRWGVLISIMIVGVLMPVFEEFLFRFYLNKLFGNILYFFINVLILLNIFYTLTTIEIVVYLFMAILILISINTLFKKRYSFRRNFYLLFKKYFYLLFYLSALTFGIMHVGNYDICNKHSILILCLVFPQCFGGLVLGYTRLKFGILSSILVHSILNTLSVCLFFLTK